MPLWRRCGADAHSWFVPQFNLSPGYVGLIMLGLSLPYCLASPLIGYFTDKYPVSTEATTRPQLFFY